MSDLIYPKVFIIILNYNGKDTLDDCLSLVFKSDYSNFEVVVVDNDSQDSSFEDARYKFSNIHFIKNPANFGFARGNNVGIRFALEKFSDYVFVLNNDALIEKSTLSILVKTAEENSACGITSPLILSADNKVWFAGGIIDWLRMKTIHLSQLKFNNPYETQYISGCAMLVKKEVFKKIGLFDERYFLYYEDADFSVRAKRAGFNLLMDPNARIKHLEQSNQKNAFKVYWLVLSGLIFFRTHSPFFNKLWILFIYLPLRKLKNFYDLFFKKRLVAKDVLRAYRDFKKAFNSNK